MAQAPRDQNDCPAALVWDSSNSTTAPIKVDPSTGRLLIDITIVSSTTPVLNGVKRDDNFVTTCAGTADNAGASVMPLLIDSRNGYLWMDIVVE